MFDAGNARHVEERRKKAKLSQREFDNYLKSVLSTSQGREFIFTLLERSHMYSSTFATNSKRMAFSEGERNIGLMLQADIARVYPEAIVLMMREANDRANSTDRADDAAANRADED